MGEKKKILKHWTIFGLIFDFHTFWQWKKKLVLKAWKITVIWSGLVESAKTQRKTIQFLCLHIYGNFAAIENRLNYKQMTLASISFTVSLSSMLLKSSTQTQNAHAQLNECGVAVQAKVHLPNFCGTVFAFLSFHHYAYVEWMSVFRESIGASVAI